MDNYTQERRRLRIDTSLGVDHMLPVSVRGHETVSQCFDFDVQVVSRDHAIRAEDVLGTSVTLHLDDQSELTQTVNGIASELVAVGRDFRGFSLYRLCVVPKLWLLTRTTDCRIFQHKTVREIVDAVLTDHGIQDREWRLHSDYESRVYCVQYRETAFDFVCRLLEEEGIFFYFKHEEKRHVVVFSDNNRSLLRYANTAVAIVAEEGASNCIWNWESACRFRSGKWSLGDYNFETPSTNLTVQKTTVNPVGRKQTYEMYDYPGRYARTPPGEAAAKVRIEYEESAYQEVSGESACVGFSAGVYFSVSDLNKREASSEYLITHVEHVAEDWSHIAQDAAPATYGNRFRCALRSAPFRPAMKTPKPQIHGTQTAVVTGPGGAEIFTDQYGRIKLHFHWDRHGSLDEDSSCWIRVAQSWAGRNFGTWFLPRVGQEVVVAFEEGDPDRPLVVGSVYNAEQTVPFALPANMTQSGLRTRSSKGGGAGDCNEFRFEDRKGAELVFLHAEKDLTTETEHDARHSVGHDETTVVGNNRTETVHANETITIDMNRTETVHANESVQIDLNRSHTIGLSEELTVGVARTHTVGAAEVITVGAARTVTVGAVQAITVGADQNIEVGANQTISVGSDQTISVSGNEATAIGKDRSATVGSNETVEAGKKIMISAGDEIVLKTGSAMIVMKKNGDISIEGKQITIKGSGDVIIKGQKILQN